MEGGGETKAQSGGEQKGAHTALDDEERGCVCGKMREGTRAGSFGFGGESAERWGIEGLDREADFSAGLFTMGP